MKTVQKSIRFTRKLSYGVLVVAIFFLLPFVVITLLASKSNILGSLKSFVIVSGSMEPSLPTGSIIYTLKKDFYSTKDIIAFSDKGRTITHRVKEVKGVGTQLYYTTKGDANSTEDSDMVAGSNVVGKTVLFVPYVGKIVMAFKTPIGFGVGIIIPSILFIFMELIKIKKEIEKETERRVLERIGALT